MLKDLSKTLKEERKLLILLTSIQFFHILDFVVVLPLGPMLMRYFFISPIEFASLASSYSLSSAIVGIIYSPFADKYNRKLILNITLIGFIGATTLCAFAPDYYSLLAARIIAGLFGGVLTPICYAIVSDIIPEKRRGNAMGILLSSFSITSILGIPTGLAIADTWGWRYTFVFIIIGSIGILLASIKFLPSLPVAGSSAKVKESMRLLIKIAFIPKHRSSYISVILFTFSGFIIFPFLSPYSVNNIGIQESELKYLYLAGGLLTVFTSQLAGKLTDSIGAMKVFYPALVLSFPFVYLYTSVENIPLYQLIIISSFFMALINARFVPAMTLATRVPSPQMRGSFMGVLTSVRSFASAAGTAFSGFVVGQSADGKLIHFDKIGILSIVITIIAIYFVVQLNKQVGIKSEKAS